jgi:hypothetical protein
MRTRATEEAVTAQKDPTEDRQVPGALVWFLATGDLQFFFDAVSMNIEKKVQSLQANSGLYAVRS